MANADWKCLLPYDAVAFIHVKSCDLYSRLLRPLMSQESVGGGGFCLCVHLFAGIY